MPFSPLPPSQLRHLCDPNVFSFQTTAQLPPAAEIIGQPRGTQAIEFGIDIDSPGYNIFVLGEEGTGRTTAIGRFLRDYAAKRPAPEDWLYVNNFAEPHKPRALNLPAGLGAGLRGDMEDLIDHLKRNLPQAFEQEAYLDSRSQIRIKHETELNTLYTMLQSKAGAAGLALRRTPEGWISAPVREGKLLAPEEFDALPEEERRKIELAQRQLDSDLEDALRAARALEKNAKDARRTLDQQVAASVVDHWIDELKNKYLAYPETVFYLTEVRQDIIEHVEDFQPAGNAAGPDADPKPSFRKYTVNLVVDHRRTQGAPVMIELNPTYGKLLGRIEYEANFGAISTDFTLIKTGALHAANGGYLVLRARDIFLEPLAWDALKRSLLSNFVRTEDITGRTGGFAPTKTLDPEPIPLTLKVILVGPPHLYYELFEFDEDFGSLFKVKADFAHDMPRTPETELQYALFIAARCAEEKLLPFSREAVAKVVEFGSREAGYQQKLSARFGEVTDLLREADYWAGKAGRDAVTAEDVRASLAEKTRRANKLEEIQRERILEGSVFIDTEGEAVGQVNALSVLSLSDYVYALPMRVTVRTFVGHGGISQLDRDINLAGPIHNKGVLTLAGYFNATYATRRPISFSAQITFEQNYGLIEGDSASAAELCALLSSLSGYPLKQSIAITGSVNQRGDLQPIGGANEKVEGFFAVCEQRGLTGEQGLIIPAANARNLMLSEKVVAAVAAGQFQIWAVNTIDEAIELFTGVPAGVCVDDHWPENTVHQAVQKRLEAMTKAQDYDHEEDKPGKKPAKKRSRAKLAKKTARRK